MRSERRATAPAQRRGPNGEPLCRWCEQPVKPPRQSWCSDACVNDYRLRSDHGYVRSLLLKRDHGICAVCGLDCVALRRAFEAWYHNQQPRRSWGYVIYDTPAAVDWLAFHRIPRGRVKGAFWDADHIVPVVEGGGACDLSNYRTLCIPCHKDATADLARRRAAARRLRGPA